MEMMNNSEAPLQTVRPEVINFINTADMEIGLHEHAAWIEDYYPRLARVIDRRTMTPYELQARIKALQACTEFSEQGRGIQWATTIEQHLRVRRTGASKLLGALQNGSSPPGRSDDYFLLDVFGGAGFIAQFAREVFGFNGTVITSDPSAVMVRLALEKGLPAFWQRAQDLFMTRDDSVDAVLFAYGTHHVPVNERPRVFEEAWRVLKPGGVLIFHDFEENTPASIWFQEVVDRYTVTGHRHEHFATGTLSSYFIDAGFELESLSTIDDCFQFTAPTGEAARMAAIEFMGGAYGLERLERTNGMSRFLWGEIKQIFPLDERSINHGSGGHEVVIHRPALLGVGKKPGNPATPGIASHRGRR
jgi:SAM-dependent methyltransferase